MLLCIKIALFPIINLRAENIGFSHPSTRGVFDIKQQNFLRVPHQNWSFLIRTPRISALFICPGPKVSSRKQKPSQAFILASEAKLQLWREHDSSRLLNNETKHQQQQQKSSFYTEKHKEIT